MGKWLEEEARRDKEVVKMSTHLATRHLVMIIKFVVVVVVVVVESVKETMEVWTHLARRQNLTKYTRKQMKCSQNWKRPNQPKSENGKQTAKDSWSKDKREEERCRCQISDDHFWGKVEPCRCKWGEVSWQSGTLASGGRSLKSGWKIVWSVAVKEKLVRGGRNMVPLIVQSAARNVPRQETPLSPTQCPNIVSRMDMSLKSCCQGPIYFAKQIFSLPLSIWKVAGTQYFPTIHFRKHIENLNSTVSV